MACGDLPLYGTAEDANDHIGAGEFGAGWNRTSRIDGCSWRMRVGVYDAHRSTRSEGGREHLHAAATLGGGRPRRSSSRERRANRGRDVSPGSGARGHGTRLPERGPDRLGRRDRPLRSPGRIDLRHRPSRCARFVARPRDARRIRGARNAARQRALTTGGRRSRLRQRAHEAARAVRRSRCFRARSSAACRVARSASSASAQAFTRGLSRSARKSRSNATRVGS